MRNRVFNLLSIIATPRIFFYFRPRFVKKKKKKVSLFVNYLNRYRYIE